MKNISENELKEITLKILKTFDEYCCHNNLKYSLFYGSMLGAVRHKGFIPWDDDIDVAMPREDYDYFVKNFSNDFYKVAYAKTKYFYLPSAKLYDVRTIKKENIHVNKKMSIGVDIDIFPLDYCDSMEHYDLIQKKKKKWIFLKILAFYPSNEINSVFKKIGAIFARPFGNFAVKRIDKIGQKYNKKEHAYLIANPMFGEEKLIFKINLFSKLENIKFENFDFKISSFYKDILTIRYGNYMELPPINKQVSHHDFEVFYK